MDPTTNGADQPLPTSPPNPSPPPDDRPPSVQPAYDPTGGSLAPAPSHYTTYQLPTIVTPPPSVEPAVVQPLPEPSAPSDSTDALPPADNSGGGHSTTVDTSLPEPALPPEPPLVIYHPSPPAASVPHLEPGQHYQLRTSRVNTTPPIWPPQPVLVEPTTTTATTSMPVAQPAVDHPFPQFLAVLKNQLAQKLSKLKNVRGRGKLKPIVSSVAIGLTIYAIFNSQMLLGQLQYLISPGTNAETPAIIDTAQTVGPSSRIIIPKINVNVPVNYKEKSYDEARIQKALEEGVVHYGTTALPGQLGNNVIVGHSSNSWWNSGSYKFAFVLLSKLEAGDTLYLNYNSRRYTYEVFQKKTVAPADLSVINQDVNEPIVTLITCDPPGTSWKRMVVQARQIIPDPKKTSVPKPAATSTQAPLPGDSSSFWRWLVDLF